MAASTSTTIVPTINLNQAEKPEIFSGKNFKQLQQKMLFYLTTLNLTKFLREIVPTLDENETDRERLAVVNAWKHDDFLCRNYILGGLSGSLYKVYSPCQTSKELWDKLDKKYKSEDAGTKKFVVNKFLDFKMVDSKTVGNQVDDYKIIFHEIEAEGMTLSESFQVAALIEKFPPSWKEFKSYLKHKKKKMNIENLTLRIRIEEDNRLSEKKSTFNSASMTTKANVVAAKSNNNKRKRSNEGTSQKQSMAKKFKGKCCNRGMQGHQSKDCRKPKHFKWQKAQANVTEIDNLSEDVSDINLSTVVSKCNLVGNPKE